MEQPRYKIVLVSFPLTPIVAYGYFLYYLAGQLTDDAYVFFHHRHKSPLAGDLEGPILAILDRKGLREQLGQLIESLGFDDAIKHLLQRMLNYVLEVKQRVKTDQNLADWSQYWKSILRMTPDVIVETVAMFSGWLGRENDPHQSVFPKLSINVPTPSVVSAPLVVPRDRLHVTIPVIGEGGPSDLEIVGYQEVEFIEANVLRLLGQRIGIVIGGPPNSGKSTVAPALTDQLGNIAKSLASREGWENLNLDIKYVNLDAGTPVGEAVLAGEALDRALLEQRKRPWTTELALEALHDFCVTQEQAHIIVSDLPGVIDDKTEIISVAANIGGN